MCSPFMGVLWHGSQKQTSIARFTIELEFVELELAINKAEWLRNFLVEIPLEMKPTFSVSMHCDSQATIAIARNNS